MFYQTRCASISVQTVVPSCVNYNDRRSDNQRNKYTDQVVKLSAARCRRKWTLNCLNEVVAKTNVQEQRNQLKHLEKQPV